MKTKTIPNLKNFLSAFLVIAGIHIAILPNLPEDYRQYEIFYGHLMLFAAAVILDFILNRVKDIDVTLIVKTFLAFSTFKIIFGFIFLLPWILNKSDETVPFIIQFFIIYFLYLAIEAVVVIRSYLSNS